jgi:phosphoribosyl-ATP pyrophosphohydrolase
VLLAWHGLTPEDVLAELERREGISGVTEKASRK